MGHFSLTTLFICLLVLIIVSAFFSSSEIGMMSLNRYRLKHLVKNGNRRARRVEGLLQKPDRLLGVILIGNTLANIVASALATLIGQRLWGDPGVAVATGALTFIILIFAEMTPKTLAALYPQQVAFSVAPVLLLLQAILLPMVRFTSWIANALLAIFNVNKSADKESLSGEELRTVVSESGNFIPRKHKRMLISLLDLEKVTVDDIMVPRQEIIGIDLNDSWEVILEQLETAQHTRLPLYDGNMHEVQGLIHIRSILNLLVEKKLDKARLIAAAQRPYFVLEGTQLNHQLLNFQHEKKRSCFVIDEYGDIQGLVTLEDILEEVIGEFTTDMAAMSKDVSLEKGGSFLVDATASVRELNRIMGWSLPEVGPKTLNGLITETLGFIPPAQCCLKLADYPVEILQVNDNMVKMVRINVSYTHDE